MNGSIWRTQFRTHTGECFRRFRAERGWKNFVSSAVIAVIICLVIKRDEMFVDFTQTRNGAFALVCACIWIGIFNSIQSICRDREEGIVKREFMKGMHTSAFVLAHLVFECVLCIVESGLVTGVFCAFVSDNLPSSGVFLPIVVELLIAFFLTIFASDALALMVSCIVKKPNTAMTVMPFILILQLVLSGFVFDLPEGGFGDIISNVTVAKWSLNAICTSANVNGMIPPPADPRHALMSDVFEKSRNACEYTAGNFLLNCAILAAFIVLYTVVGVLLLKLAKNDKRDD